MACSVLFPPPRPPAMSPPCRDSNPADWALYAGMVEPLDTLFNPAYRVSRVIAHEGFDWVTRRNDIALMKLSEHLDFTGV